jgi:hypothetical protein
VAVVKVVFIVMMCECCWSYAGKVECDAEALSVERVVMLVKSTKEISAD